MVMFSRSYISDVVRIMRTCEHMGFLLDQIPIVWDKQRYGFANAQQYHLPRNYETIIYGRKEAGVILSPKPNVMSFKAPTHGEKTHPFEKPVELLKHLIPIFCTVGNSIIDPCCGSGFALVAGIELGMSVTGIEVSEKWRAVAIYNVNKAYENREAKSL